MSLLTTMLYIKSRDQLRHKKLHTQELYPRHLKLKINRAFQDEAPQVLAPSRIEDKRVMVKKNNQRQADLFAMGKSSYSSDNTPSFQVSMLRGEISGSQMTTADSGACIYPSD
jgi:hypothetical protein